MLEIKINETTLWDEAKEEFIDVPSIDLHLEHSLKSISKWESLTHKSFLDTTEKGMTSKETIEYIKCMNLDEKEIRDEILCSLSASQIEEIQKYIEDPMTATTFQDRRKNLRINAGRHKEIITAEIVYYWMIEAGIPLECENWHFNKLLTLIRVFSVKNDSGNKMSKRESMAFNKALMAERRASHGKH